MRAMELDAVDAGADRAPGRGYEALTHPLHVVGHHRARHMPIAAERNGRRSDRLPGILSRSERLRAFPGPLRRGLAAGVRQLDAELGRAVTTAMRDHPCERRLAIIGIEAETAVRDAAVALDVRRLDYHQRSAGIGEHAEMTEVPVVGDPVVGAVLAHGRNDDAIRQFQISEPDRSKQGTGHVFSVERSNIDASSQD